MDKVQIKSSPIEAQAAIGELLGLDVSQKDNKQVEFSYSSSITGMENGKEVTNQMLEAVGKFSEAVLIQTINFLKLLKQWKKEILSRLNVGGVKSSETRH